MKPGDLRRAGLKVTSPRLKVLKALESSRDGHVTADEIYRRIADDGEEQNLASIYRVLSQSEKAGLVRRQSFESGKAVFELTDGSHHDHMVCPDTGAVIEFYDERIERRQREIADRLGYEIEEHNHVVYVRPAKGSTST